MARKGSRKVRTGCQTCKAESELTNLRVRKVKCDETKPACVRCTSTGRKCDGYPTKLKPDLTWCRPSHLFLSIDHSTEGRALQFFCETAGPHLSGPLDSYFWTHLVLQFSNFEPAVRHSLVAISSLYEDFHCNAKTANQLQANTFALRHYNAAIENLRKLDNEPLILLVCILFVCIEILQNNRDSAIQHCRHGVIMLQRIGNVWPWTVEHLSPIFRRLSVFPLFFGNSSDSFPRLGGLDAPIPTTFVSYAEAQYCMDAIICRASRLIRHGDAYRIGKYASRPVDPELLEHQRDLQQTIEHWHASFQVLVEKLNLSESENTAYGNVMLRYRLARMWSRGTFEKDEVFYDDYIPDLTQVIDRAIEHSPNMAGTDVSPPRPRFSFEVGALPFVVFVIIRCRDLRTRLRGLQYLRDCGPARENMWQANRMYPVCKRLVEIEHDIVLGEDDQPVGEVAWDEKPSEVMRAKDFATSPEPACRENDDGSVVWGGLANFAMRTADGRIWTRREFLPGPDPRRDKLEY
ncbi:hypothetical protein SCUP234_13224 [Seiridium cupressi]